VKLRMNMVSSIS